MRSAASAQPRRHSYPTHPFRTVSVSWTKHGFPHERGGNHGSDAEERAPKLGDLIQFGSGCRAAE
jgi:hypothetical protein